MAVEFAETLRVWLKIGCLGFGGPARQIALMHRILVDEKRWVEESRYLHALNFCMLLPGPEAQKLATYVGWLLHGTRGGPVAGLLFVRPGALVMLGVSLLYALGQGIAAVDGALFGIKAAVLGIFFFAPPFPLIVAAAGSIGFFTTKERAALRNEWKTEVPGRKPRAPHSPGSRCGSRPSRSWYSLWAPTTCSSTLRRSSRSSPW